MKTHRQDKYISYYIKCGELKKQILNHLSMIREVVKEQQSGDRVPN